MVDLLGDLNNKQREAVIHTEGPLLILAGAGSGKTRVLVHRIAYILKENKASSEEILALTFTNKAAEEMKKRVKNLVKYEKRMWITTFHAAGVRVLRKHAPKIGIENNFNILDSKDQQGIIKDCLKELNFDNKRFHPMAILKVISSAKNELLESESFTPGDYFQEKALEVYKLYEKKKKFTCCLDFDDLIMLTVKLFRQHPKVLEDYQKRFKYILVDEYQDTNYAQYIMVSLLASYRKNLCVVGDDDQSIYQFRGADLRNILEFEKDFPEAFVIKLEENYRSYGNILEAANSVVKNNLSRKEKKLWTLKPEGDKLYFYECDTDRDEAYFIAREIKKRRQGNLQIAILYRINAQSRILEEVFLREGIPYTIIGSQKFYDRKEIKDIIAYLKVLANPRDDISLKRIINVPRRGIGDKTVQKIEELTTFTGEPIIATLQKEKFWSSISSAAEKKLSTFIKVITNLREIRDSISIKELTEKILADTGYIQVLEDEGTEEAFTRIENLREFINATDDFNKTYEGSVENRLVSFLERISLVSDLDNLSDEGPPVVLMTLHSAKGLEFPVVFMAGMEEKLLPHSRSLDEDNLEEERRLCYVGITRAEERLYLSRAKKRMLFNDMIYTLPSRFLQEIPQDLIINLNESSIRSTRQNEKKPSLMIKTENHRDDMPAISQDKLKVGHNIVHAKWGNGTIKEIKDLDGDKVLTVLFPNVGVKKIMARYAPIQLAEN